MFIVDTALSTVYRRNNHADYTCQFRLILGDSIGMFRAISTRGKVKGGGGGGVERVTVLLYSDFVFWTLAADFEFF